jgi:hypothetical protein
VGLGVTVSHNKASLSVRTAKEIVMTKTRAFASLTVATALGGSALLGTLVAPTAHADPILDPIAGAVNATRAQSTCSPLNYSPQLEADAQAYARRPENDTPMPGGYPGPLKAVQATNDPTSKATAGMIVTATPYIKDCKYKDFGVGMVRSGTDESSVAVVLGQGAPPPAPAAPAPAPNSNERVHCERAGGGYDLPPGSDCSKTPNPNPPPAAAPVTNAIQLSFGPPHLGSITATVANSSDLTAECTYDSTPFNTHRDFTVNPKGSMNLTFNGFNTGTSYHVVVSCHDASGKQTQEIGHAETNVTF